jgi:hypothetical protein
MSSTTEMKSVEVIVKLAEEQLTEAIVSAARSTKRTRKPKITAEVERSAVDEIIENLRSGKFAADAIATLERVFGRKMDIEEDEPKKLTELEAEEPKEPQEPKEKKVRKPRAKKVSVATETDEPVAIETPVIITVTAETKTKKPRAKKVVEAPVAIVETVVPVTTSDEKPKKARKPRAKKTEEPETAVSDSDESTVTSKPVVTTSDEKPKKVRKPRVKKTESPTVAVEVTEVVEEKTRNTTPILVSTLENEFGIDGFSAEWSEELVEEELSDIDDE